MRRRTALPPEESRCVATARWSGDGNRRCRKVAIGPDRLCKAHQRSRSRPEPSLSELVQRLASVPLGEGREIRVDLRERDGSRFVAVRLHLSGIPTRKGFTILPNRLRDLAEGLRVAAREIEA